MGEQPITIIYVDGMAFRRNKAEALVRGQIPGATFVHASSYNDGIKELKGRDPDVVVFELELPYPGKGDSLNSGADVNIIPVVQAHRPRTQMIATSLQISGSTREAFETSAVPLLDRGKLNFPDALIAQMRTAITARGKTISGAAPA